MIWLAFVMNSEGKPRLRTSSGVMLTSMMSPRVSLRPGSRSAEAIGTICRCALAGAGGWTRRYCFAA